MICKEEYKRQKVPQNFLNLQKIHNFLREIKSVQAVHAPNEKRCYDVTLSRQEGSTARHLASAV